MAENCELRDAVRDFRRRTGITQAELASKLQVSERYIRAIEHGHNLGPASLRKLANIMQSLGYVDIARCVRQMALSERDYRSLTIDLGLLRNALNRLEDRVAYLEGRQRAARGAA
jgi:transcriptional regulator with XRE-family HTH domain